MGKSVICDRNSGDFFGYISLIADLDQGRHQTQAIALTTSEIWFLHEAQFRQLIQQYTEIEHLLNTLLAEDLNGYITRIDHDQRRIQGLQPYLQAIPPGETILGDSKATQNKETSAASLAVPTRISPF